MRGIALGVTAALALLLGSGLGQARAQGAAPDAGSQSVEACLRGCDASDSDTDRATCRITCEERQNAKEQPDIVKWSREELKGGSPDPTVERGSTTTITEISPSGTKTKVIKDPGKPGAKTAARRPFVPVGLVYTHCQSRCEAKSAFGDRAQCRLRCAEKEFRRRTRANRPKPRPYQAVERASKPTPSSKTKSKPSRACTSKCLRAAATCQDRCRGSDRSTCVLHCDQTLATCERRCE